MGLTDIVVRNGFSEPIAAKADALTAPASEQSAELADCARNCERPARDGYLKGPCFPCPRIE